MKKAALILCAALVAVPALSAQQAPPTPPPPATEAAAPAAATIAGNWTISMDYGQGPTDIGAMFKLDGKKVTGALTSEMGELPLAGEYNEGKLTFVIDVQGMSLTFTAALKDADNLNGSMAGQMGEIPFVGKRVKG
jgi:hypothetical protein